MISRCLQHLGSYLHPASLSGNIHAVLCLLCKLTRVFMHSDHTLRTALHCVLSQHMDHADAWRRKACRASHCR